MTEAGSIVLLYSPFPSLEAARGAARALLETRLVACCNLLPGMESHYRWEEAIAQEAEVVLIAKTSRDMAEKASEMLAGLHPYQCPAILQIPATANAMFAAWMGAELKR